MLSSAFLKPLLWVSASLGLLYVVLTPFFEEVFDNQRRSGCLSNTKQIWMAYAQYAQDSDEVSPPISSSDKGWADLLQPYTKSWKIFQCPSGRKTAKSRRTDYFYNARLTKAKVSKLPFPSQTILFGDGYDNSGANAHLSELPLDWRNDEYSLERRHPSGFNFVFMDGHIKTCRPEKVSIQPPSDSHAEWKPTFAVR